MAAGTPADTSFSAGRQGVGWHAFSVTTPSGQRQRLGVLTRQRTQNWQFWPTVSYLIS